MGVIKWVGYVLVALIIICIVIGGSAIISVLTIIFVGIAIFATVVVFISYCVKEWFDSR